MNAGMTMQEEAFASSVVYTIVVPRVMACAKGSVSARTAKSVSAINAPRSKLVESVLKILGARSVWLVQKYLPAMHASIAFILNARTPTSAENVKILFVATAKTISIALLAEKNTANLVAVGLETARSAELVFVRIAPLNAQNARHYLAGVISVVRSHTNALNATSRSALNVRMSFRSAAAPRRENLNAWRI